MNYASPESMGISSAQILKFVEQLEKHHLNTHSLIISKGNTIVYENYWAPFHKDYLHRMYSVSKSFVSLAIGFAEQDGLLCLDDPIIKYFPKEVLLYDMKPTDVLTKDKQSMQVDNYVIWRIVDPLTFYKTLDNIENAESRIDALTYSAIQTEMGGMERDKIIKQDDVESRDSLNIKVIDAISKAAKTYGIEIIDVKIKKLDLPEDNEQAVYNRMIAERNEMAAKERAEGETEAAKIKNQIDKETGILISEAQKNAEITKAEGENEYMRILAEAYSDEGKKEFYEFIRSLEALELSLTGETTIILSSDSVIAQALLAP